MRDLQSPFCNPLLSAVCLGRLLHFASLLRKKLVFLLGGYHCLRAEIGLPLMG